MFEETPGRVRFAQILWVFLMLLDVYALTEGIKLVPILGIVGFGLLAFSHQLRHRRIVAEGAPLTKAAGIELHLIWAGCVALLVRIVLQIAT